MKMRFNTGDIVQAKSDSLGLVCGEVLHPVFDMSSILSTMESPIVSILVDAETIIFVEENNVSHRTTRKDECLFCKSRSCYDRVVAVDGSYDEIACLDHIRKLNKHSDAAAPDVLKHFISSSAKQKRGQHPLI